MVLTHEQVTLAYTIDLETDVVDEIAFSTGDTDRGVLRFSYLQSVADVGKGFVSPRNRSYRGGQQHNLGLLWLMQLADGSLEK